MSVNQIPGSTTGYIGTPGGASADPAARKVPVGAPTVQEIDGKALISKGGAGLGRLPPPTPEKTSPGAPADTAKALAAFSPVMVEADIYAVMALFQKMAQEQRNGARQVRDSELQVQVGTLMKAADEIRSAAQDRFVGAVLAGSMQIVGGAVQAGFGMKAMTASSAPKGSSDAVKQPSNNTSLTAKGSDAAKPSPDSNSLTTTGSGLSQSIVGIGSIANAGFEQKASEHDAKKAELEAQAKVHESASQQANELMQQMMDVIRDVRDKLGSIEQSRLETTRGIARNI